MPRTFALGDLYFIYLQTIATASFPFPPLQRGVRGDLTLRENEKFLSPFEGEKQGEGV
jgi:hypothetical protein